MQRRILAAILACSLAAAAAAPAEAGQRDTLRGKTNQGFRIRLAATSHSVQVLRFKAELKCRNGTKLLLDESGFLKTPVAQGGNFRDVQYGSTDTVYLRGRAKGGSVSGRVRLTDKLKGGVRCRSHWLRFHLKK